MPGRTTMIKSRSMEAFCHLKAVTDRRFRADVMQIRRNSNTAIHHEQNKVDFPLLHLEGPRK